MLLLPAQIMKLSLQLQQPLFRIWNCQGLVRSEPAHPVDMPLILFEQETCYS